MVDERFDVLVVGSGPAGSTAALVLARGGARVALLDKASFPRDKACGDLVGPRGVRLLADLGVDVPGALTVADMVVIGPTGRRVRLPCTPGLTYPGHALAVPRSRFDASLRDAAVAAGALPVTGQARDPIPGPAGLAGFTLAGGGAIRADVVVGADGATSRVATAARLVDARRVLWGFAIRAYLDEPVDTPYIVFWERQRWQGLPGYGWLFPGPDGRANVGLGVGTLGERTSGAQAVRLLPEFLDHAHQLGLISGRPASRGRLGGWLKMGMVGTTPAGGGALLVGDAAGLVNPLQGEGIAQAMGSGRAAAEAVLAGPGDAARRYRAALAGAHLPYHATAAAAQAVLLPRPAAVSAVGRAVTLPGLGALLAGGWSLFWNELVDGAPPGPARATAAMASRAGRLATRRSATARWLAAAYPQAERCLRIGPAGTVRG